MLSTDFLEVTRTIARRLGYPLQESDRSEAENESIHDCIRCGLRWFYFPTGELSHVWSFLRRFVELQVSNDQQWYVLPEDFVRFASTVSISNTQSPLAVTNEDGIRLRTNNDPSPVADGKAKYCALRTAEIRGNTRYEIGIYPILSTTVPPRTIQIWYQFEPKAVSVDNPFPYGGATHAETVMAACLAAAEQQMNPETMAQEGGVHWQYFQSQLAGSVATDKLLVGV
jgi:hypothetical protein